MLTTAILPGSTFIRGARILSSSLNFAVSGKQELRCNVHNLRTKGSQLMSKDTAPVRWYLPYEPCVQETGRKGMKVGGTQGLGLGQTPDDNN